MSISKVIVALYIGLSPFGLSVAYAQQSEKVDSLSIEAKDVRGIFVEVSNGWSSAQLENLLQRFASENSIQVSKIYKDIDNFWIIEFTETLTRSKIRPLVEQLRQVPKIISVDINVVIVPASVPNDDGYAQQDELHDSREHSVKAETAWDIVGGLSKTALMTVVDSGMLPDPDVHKESYTGWDFYSGKSGAIDEGSSTSPTSPGCEGEITSNVWHGLKVASLMVAITNNGEGIASLGSWPSKGLVPNWVPVRVSGCKGGDLLKLSYGIRWSVGTGLAGAPAHAWKARVIMSHS